MPRESRDHNVKALREFGVARALREAPREGACDGKRVLRQRRVQSMALGALLGIALPGGPGGLEGNEAGGVGAAGLARAGLLDGRNHTSSARGYLAATGYTGGDHYLDERAVVDGDLITAGPQSPVQFARATMGRLGLASERTLEAYEALFQ